MFIKLLDNSEITFEKCSKKEFFQNLVETERKKTEAKLLSNTHS